MNSAEESIDCEKYNSETSDSVQKCQQWLTEKCTISETSSACSSSIVSESTEADNQIEITDVKVLCQNRKTKNYDDVKVYNSENVVIGDIIYVTGPIHVTQKISHIRQEQILNQIFLDDNGSAITQRNEKLRIVSRMNWLAQSASKKIALNKPIQYVIIAHTATEEAFTQAKNTLIVRLIQSLDIEGQKLNDISYNFLIGSDGNIYEGRGWDLQGEHTPGYDAVSIAIAFVGCFREHLPKQSALNAAKGLIQLGRKLDVISEEFSLIGQNQCLSIESPGRKLFEEIKTWPQWRELRAEELL